MEVYVVSFRGERDVMPASKRTWYFSSIAAIYDVFNESEIGCSLRTLWNNGVAKGHEYVNKKVSISKHTIHAKKQASNGL